MPKLAPPLTDIQPCTAKAEDKPDKLADGSGLYLLVNQDGAKHWWRMDYTHSGKRQAIVFGKYADVSLAEARNKRSRRGSCWTKASTPCR
jgi:hypothetical protein